MGMLALFFLFSMFGWGGFGGWGGGFGGGNGKPAANDGFATQAEPGAESGLTRRPLSASWTALPNGICDSTTAVLVPLMVSEPLVMQGILTG